jgi:hypothetical protein
MTYDDFYFKSAAGGIWLKLFQTMLLCYKLCYKLQLVNGCRQEFRSAREVLAEYNVKIF